MNILSIAGSDPSSGAGIQSDIKTFYSLGAYGFSIITAITSQNSSKFSTIEPISTKMIKSQLDSVLSDFKIDAIKIGMVYNSSAIKAVNSKLKGLNIPIVVDPVLKSTTGGSLIEKNAINDLKKFLVPLASVITPNVSEAEKLTRIKIKTRNDLLKSAKKIRKMGAKNVIITGNQFEKGKITDFILEDSKTHFITGKKFLIKNHGSGCNFSSSLTVELVKRKKIVEATKFAKNFTANSIKNAKKIGKGVRITQSILQNDEEENFLRKGIGDFQKLKNIYTAIPECQTNFVYSKLNPKSNNDVLGVEGRLVRVGKNVIMAGDIKYGGSKHVASAIIEMTKKFPTTRASVNLKLDSKIITKSKKRGFLIKSYNRAKEPKLIKNKENSSVSWGIKKAIKNSSQPPDIIFHKGDYGKEPMILVFGRNPSEVVKKISNILSQV